MARNGKYVICIKCKWKSFRIHYENGSYGICNLCGDKMALAANLSLERKLSKIRTGVKSW